MATKQEGYYFAKWRLDQTWTMTHFDGTVYRILGDASTVSEAEFDEFRRLPVQRFDEVPA